MSPLTKTCRINGKNFVITDEDQAFYAKMNVPMPTLCPEERTRRRLAFRNERHLYHRKCDLSGKTIISNYSPDKAYKVYDQKEWWSDKWNALDYGRDFDFSRPFFEQFAELMKVVPRLSLLSMNNENSDYTNCVTNLKNCYLLFSSDFSQDCYYGDWTQNSRNCIDNYLIDKSELAYECYYSQGIYRSIYIFNSSNCNDSAFLYDCRGCNNCFMSYGLRNKQYCFENQQLSKEEYEKKMSEIDLGSNEVFSKMKNKFFEFIKDHPRLYLQKMGRVESSSGDLFIDTENCHESFQVVRGKDCKFIQSGFEIKDIYDSSYVNGELGYENCECFPMPYNAAFNVSTYTGHNLFYTDSCMNNCSNCFGCIGLRNAEYCIFNKQYTKEEYFALREKIIEHMEKTGEWGEFFPIELSPFGYNETNAQEFFPIQKEEALAKNYKWKEGDENSSYSGPTVNIPDNINNVSDEITKQILKCEVSGKLYKVIPQELEFYRNMKLALPRRSPEQRWKDRFAMQNPRHLWDRKCDNCRKDIRSTYALNRPEKVYCEDCYLKIVY